VFAPGGLTAALAAPRLPPKENELSPSIWALTIVGVIALFVLDLAVSGRRLGDGGFRAAAGWSLFYTAVALVFGLVLALLSGWGLGGQYFAGFLVEKTLSIDNLFVFVIIIGTFAVPAEYQSRALTAGIVFALMLRGVFIFLGATLLEAFSFMFLIFGLVLLVTAVQLFRHRESDPRIEDNPVVSAARRVLPISPDYDRGRFITARQGRRMLTPMFLVLVAIGTTDLLFALDSIPAVFGVTTSAYVVFCANAFALLGLRPLFALVSGLLNRLVYLALGLSAILGLIGVKLVLHFAHLQNDAIPEISTGASLCVIAVILAVTTVASLRRTRRDPSLKAHPGSLHGTARLAERPLHAGSTGAVPPPTGQQQSECEPRRRRPAPIS
jgi:tellurite resistance protein TerC